MKTNNTKEQKPAEGTSLSVSEMEKQASAICKQMIEHVKDYKELCRRYEIIHAKCLDDIILLNNLLIHEAKEEAK